MVPETSKTITTGPGTDSAALNDPGPVSFRLVTRTIVPPRPPGVIAPKPCAPGKARRPGGGGGGGGGAATTVTLAVPLWFSLVAVSVAVPATTAVTSPVLEIVATIGLELVQVIARPVSVVPVESRRVAVS